MKRVLCFGDSNTWGYNPVADDRYDRDTRWTGILRNQLGDGYEIIEEGLNGRTTVWNDPIEGYRNGYEYLIPCLETHHPLDLVVILLGTNDLKKRFSLSAYDIAQGAAVLAKTAMKSAAGYNSQPPKVLLIAPAPIARLSNYAEMFEGAKEKSHKLGKHYCQVAEELGCDFLDLAGVVVSSDVDGIHFDPSEHQKLGLAVSQKVHEIIG